MRRAVLKLPLVFFTSTPRSLPQPSSSVLPRADLAVARFASVDRLPWDAAAAVGFAGGLRSSAALSGCTFPAFDWPPWVVGRAGGVRSSERSGFRLSGGGFLSPAAPGGREEGPSRLLAGGAGAALVLLSGAVAALRARALIWAIRACLASLSLLALEAPSPPWGFAVGPTFAAGALAAAGWTRAAGGAFAAGRFLSRST